MTTTTTVYAVYVLDDGGWGDGCPDYESVFFGAPLPRNAKYVSGSHLGGHVEFDSRAAAARFLREMNMSGDWEVPRAARAEVGELPRPVYAMAEIEVQDEDD